MGRHMPPEEEEDVKTADEPEKQPEAKQPEQPSFAEISDLANEARDWGNLSNQ